MQEQTLGQVIDRISTQTAQRPDQINFVRKSLVEAAKPEFPISYPLDSYRAPTIASILADRLALSAQDHRRLLLPAMDAYAFAYQQRAFQIYGDIREVRQSSALQLVRIADHLFGTEVPHARTFEPTAQGLLNAWREKTDTIESAREYGSDPEKEPIHVNLPGQLRWTTRTAPEHLSEFSQEAAIATYMARLESALGLTNQGKTDMFGQTTMDVRDYTHQFGNLAQATLDTGAQVIGRDQLLARDLYRIAAGLAFMASESAGVMTPQRMSNAQRGLLAFYSGVSFEPKGKVTVPNREEPWYRYQVGRAMQSAVTIASEIQAVLAANPNIESIPDDVTLQGKSKIKYSKDNLKILGATLASGQVVFPWPSPVGEIIPKTLTDLSRLTGVQFISVLS